jgi:hypothetical protein
MTEGTPPTPEDEPTPSPRPRASLVTIAITCGLLGAMMGGSALGVQQASRRPAPSIQVVVVAAAVDAGTVASQEANPETAGDGVMDELDDTPDAGSVVIRPEAMAGALMAAAAPPDTAEPRRRDRSIVTSDDVPEGPAQGFVEGRATRIVVTRLDSKPVEVHTASAYSRMRDAAARDHIRLRIVSGFRTMAHQQALYRAYRRGRGNLAAVPGQSNHQSGHALDLNTSSPGVLRWLERNARRFGFRRTVPTEPWHWEWW